MMTIVLSNKCNNLFYIYGILLHCSIALFQAALTKVPTFILLQTKQREAREAWEFIFRIRTRKMIGTQIIMIMNHFIRYIIFINPYICLMLHSGLSQGSKGDSPITNCEPIFLLTTNGIYFLTISLITY